MSDPFTPDPRAPPTPEAVFRLHAPAAAPQPDAADAPARRTPTRAPDPPTRVRPLDSAHAGTTGAPVAPRVPRDRAILIRLARARVLALPELAVLAAPGRHRSRISRRVSALERAGLVSVWEEPRRFGGRPRLVLPTRAGLRWALERLRVCSAGLVHERLLSTMLASDRREPLTLPIDRIPSWLPHLLEVNAVLAELQTNRDLAVTWASSWFRPFPNRAYGVRLPQPDAVILLAPENSPRRFVFLEHDRNTESLPTFARKVDRYRTLSQRPALLCELTGFDASEVWVTVAAGDRTERRIEDLRRIARASYAERLLRFMPFKSGRPNAART